MSCPPPQPSHRLPKRAGNAPAAAEAQIAPLPPSARQPAAAGVENFAEKRAFEQLGAPACPIAAEQSGGQRPCCSHSPPESIPKPPRVPFALIPPRRCNSYLGRGSAATNRARAPQTLHQGAAWGWLLSTTNLGFFLLWECVFFLCFSPSQGPGMSAGDAAGWCRGLHRSRNRAQGQLLGVGGI